MDDRKNKGLGKSVVVVGLTAALSQLLSVGYLTFLARWIGPNTYALHVAIFNLCAISAFAVNWGLDTWLLKKTSDDQLSSKDVLQTVLLIKLIFGILWAILLFSIAPLLKPDIFLRPLLILAILSTLFESLTNSIYTVLLTTNRFKWSSAILLIGRFSRLGSLIGLYFLSANNLSLIITLRTVIDLLVLIVAGVIFGFQFTNWKIAPDDLKKAFTSATPFHASDLINIVFHHVDVTLVTFLSKSLETISSYSLMISLYNVINTIILSLMNVVVPSLSRERNHSGPGHRKTLLWTISGFFLLGLAGWVAITLFGQNVIQLILGNQYLMVAELISRTAVIVMINSLNVGFTVTIIVSNRQKARVVPQIVSLIFKVAASLLLFPVWQIEGLRWVYILSEIVLSLGYFLVISGVLQDVSESKDADKKFCDKLNIVLITFNQEGKGTYLRAYFLGKELTELGHKVTILAAENDGSRTRERLEDGMKVVTFPRLVKGIFLSGWGFDELIFRLFWLRNKEFDLVHIFECRPTTYFPARVLQRKGAAFFTDWADWLGKGGSVEERPNGIKKSLLTFFETYFENKRFQNSDGNTAICSTLANECVKRGYPQERVLLLPNGLCNPYIQSVAIDVARTEKHLQQKDLIIGYLGSGFEKDIALMYSSFNTLHKLVEEAKLLHVGRSNYQLEPDGAIICTGPVSYEDVSYFLSACDIFWFPLRMTQANYGRMPLKFSDYLTIGRPIVCTDVGDLADWIKTLQVGLVGLDDPESIRHLVLEIFRSPEQQSKMGVNAIKASKNYEYSWKKRAEELQNFYFSQITRSKELNEGGIYEVQMLQQRES
ncbi:MAG TPA: glycosyltransferase [Anaerolineaceae bacterium]|nr:glycosyltransferase [Anaerolineaceae bacterium]